MQQLNLIPSPRVAPTLPAAGLVRDALDYLLSGRSLDHPTFEAVTGSWRLAAYVGDLRRLGWPIEADAENIGPHRNVARYRIAPETLAELRAVIGQCPSCAHCAPLSQFADDGMASHQPSAENATARDSEGGE